MEIENISVHIENISKEEWSRLFALIPIIESTKVFSVGGEVIEDKKNPANYTITPEFGIPLVDDFLDIMEDLKLIIPFDWSHWDNGKAIFEKGEYKDLDTVTLLKLLTAFIRADRFSYGAGLADRFEDRTIEKILNEIEKNTELKFA